MRLFLILVLLAAGAFTEVGSVSSFVNRIESLRGDAATAIAAASAAPDTEMAISDDSPAPVTDVQADAQSGSGDAMSERLFCYSEPDKLDSGMARVQRVLATAVIPDESVTALLVDFHGLALVQEHAPDSLTIAPIKPPI
jgi:hypothetical protein